MNNTFVSIALCTYNGGDFLEKQLQSILAQTHTSFELIIVDDCSSDNTKDIIKKFSAADSRITWYDNEVNIGFNANFEKAIHLCSGDYIAISDQDDIWSRNKIEVLLAAIGNNLLAHSNSVYMDEQDQVLKNRLFPEDRNGFLYNEYKNFLLANHMTGHTCLLHRSLLDKALPFPHGCFYDWCLGFVAAYEQKIVYVDCVLTKYRVHERSVIQQYAINAKERRYGYIKLENETVWTHLRAFSKYAWLSKVDIDFIKELHKYYEQRKVGYFAIGLYSFLLKNFEQLFPGNIKKGLKRLAFLYRYCRGGKLLKIT